MKQKMTIGGVGRTGTLCLALPAIAIASLQPRLPREVRVSAASTVQLAQPLPTVAVVARARVSPTRCVAWFAAGNGRRIAFGTPSAAEELAANLDCLLAGSVRGGRWGIMVVSLTRGDTIYARDADHAMLPASAQKLFTSAVALDQLGEDWHFTTDVLRTGTVDASGVLHGDLIIRGGGDPAFSDKFVESDGPAPVQLLADRVYAAGIIRITGDLVADPSAFESRLVPDGWQRRYLDAPYAARVSALSLNENVASIVVAPGVGDESALANLDPAATTMEIRSSVRTVPGRRGSSIAVLRVDDLTLEARGWIGGRTAPRRLPVVVEDPANFTAGAFRSSLMAHGVRIGGSTIVSQAPAGALLVTQVESPPLSRLITAMNRESINHYAELIFRNAGRGGDGLLPGSAESGFMRLSDFLTTKVGTEPGGVYAVDGSGLSVLDRATPRALVQLLDYAHRAPWGQVFHSSLPVAGQSATLRTRMQSSPADGNLHAKTGTTSEVAALSGYVTAENGEILAFAFMYNGTDRDRARATIDYLGAALPGLSRR